MLVPLRDKYATTVARTIFHHVFLKYGAGEILTDNGLEFQNELLNELFQMHGVEPRLDVDFKLGNDTVHSSTNDYADLLLSQLESAHSLTRKHLQVTASRMRDWYDKRVHAQEFQPGDEVYVLNLRLYQGHCQK